MRAQLPIAVLLVSGIFQWWPESLVVNRDGVSAGALATKAPLLSIRKTRHHLKKPPKPHLNGICIVSLTIDVDGKPQKWALSAA